MLTFDFDNVKEPLYIYIYNCIKNEILEGNLVAGSKLPSKRSFAQNSGVSTITVQNAYDQLVGEGFIYSIPKKGYYVSDIEMGMGKTKNVSFDLDIEIPKSEDNYFFDFSSNKTDEDNFPFSVWAKVMRETINNREKELMTVSMSSGVYELREAIAKHLASFRGMSVDPNQIIIGAGTEYLYNLLIKLLGTKKIYAIENPGYIKLKRIYDDNGVESCFVDMDENGISVSELRKTDAMIAHICPTHHFPTGITMPINRRYELLSWLNEERGRYIIEDDYDSEFRINGRPVSTLQSIDISERVIYMNTFSKSLASTIRISYMVLPRHLANMYYEKLSFYSCTVSTFEQYTLAAFISQGYFEKHINRMRLHYRRKREKVLSVIKEVLHESMYNIIENDSGLHFIMELNTKYTDYDIEEKMKKNNIKVLMLKDFYFKSCENNHKMILNYSNMNIEGLREALEVLKRCCLVE